MPAQKLVDGFAVSGFRGFHERQEYDGLTDINVFIGKNNVGKSSALLAAEKTLTLFTTATASVDGRDFTDACDTICFELKLSMHSVVGNLFFKLFFEQLPNKTSPDDTRLRDVNIWFLWRATKGNKSFSLDFDHAASSVLHSMNDGYIAQLCSTASKYSAEDIIHRVKEAIAEAQRLTLIKWRGKNTSNSAKIIMIPSKRQIDKSDKSSNFSPDGKGTIPALAQMKNTTSYERHERDWSAYCKYVDFLKELFLDEDLDIRIPHSNDDMYLKINGNWKPIDNLGTGIHELVLLGIPLTLNENSLVCIEEPENHIHPSLQKLFLKIVQSNTSNQYLVASHSNSALDFEQTRLYRCSRDEGYNRIESSLTVEQKQTIVKDLGVRASDILQTNCAIWLEGPSDRIYVKSWLETVDPRLREGIEFGFVFYGGSVLSHLELPVDNDTDLLNVLCINRHSAIIFDSDKSSPKSEVATRKSRILRQCQDTKSFGWETAGREIENYLPIDSLMAAVKEVHTRSTPIEKEWGQFACLTQKKSGRDGKPSDIDKVKVAEKVVSKGLKLSEYNLDLEVRVNELAEFIRLANHLDHNPEPIIPESVLSWFDSLETNLKETVIDTLQRRETSVSSE